jgi:drug/metabolite transporter (DMT)-like permease
VSGIFSQPVAVILAFAAAICFAFANVLQQRVASRLPTTAAFDTGVLLKLARRPLWLVGFVAVIMSISLQAAALGMGRLVVIEPVLASSLLVALAMSAWADHRRMRPREWAAALTTFAGLAVFLVVSQPSGGRQTAATLQLGLAAAGALCVAGIAALIAVRFRAVRRALILGIGGGIAAGVTDALTKTVAFLAGARHLTVFADPRLYLLVFVGLLAYTIQQNGYRAAGLAAFLPAFAVLDPAVGSVLGMAIYHERLGGGPARIVIETAAAIAAIWGIARLASSSATVSGVPDRGSGHPHPVTVVQTIELAVPVQAVPVQAVPMQAVPMQAIPMQAIPMQPVPVQPVPVQAVEQVPPQVAPFSAAE